MSLIVEARYEKREILEAYLNEIYLGQRGADGRPRRRRGARTSTSARTPASCSVAEAALLAAMIHSPNGLLALPPPGRGAPSAATSCST